MKNQKLFRVLTVLFLFTVILLGCTNRQSTMFAEDQCKLPCWQGVSFGMNPDKVLAILKENPNVDVNSIEMTSYEDS